MNAVLNESPRTARYAQVVRLSRKSEWQIDRDLLQDRQFDFTRNFLPAALSRVDTMPFLAPRDARLLSQLQGRTYAYIFGLVERFISAKMLDQGRAHALDDQHAMEALVRFTNDELKHQELFRRVEMMIGEKMPMGYRQVANASDVARAVLAASTWSVLALTCHIELFVQSHYAESIVTTADLCPLFKERCATTAELADWLAMYFTDVQPRAEDLAAHVTEAVKPAITALRDKLAQADWSKAAINAAIKETIAAHGLKMPQLAHAVRVLVCGRAQTPSIDAVLELFPREVVLSRLQAA